MSRVIVLNLDYTYLNSVPLKKAIKYIVNKKVEVLKSTSQMITNAEKTFTMNIPLVVRLVKLVRLVYKNKVPFSKRNILARDENTCQYCGTKKSKLTIDHVIPASRGGKTNWENCVAACKKCNNFKDNKTPNEARMTLKRIPYQPTIMEFLLAKMRSLGVGDLLKELEIY